MTAYAIGDVKITDPSKFEKYRGQAPATVKKYGGRYIVRGGPIAGYYRIRYHDPVKEVVSLKRVQWAKTITT